MDTSVIAERPALAATNTKALLFERQRVRGLVSEAKDKKVELQEIVDDMARLLGKALNAKISRDFIYDTLAGFHDAAVNADGPHNNTLEDAGEPWAWLDLHEIDDLLAKVKA